MSNLSYSRLSTWMRCHYAHQIGYTMGLEPRVTKPKMTLGSVVHHGLAFGLRQLWEGKKIGLVIPQVQLELQANKAMESEGLFDEEIEALEELVDELATPLTVRTLRYLDERYKTITHGDGPMIERGFVVPIDAPWDGYELWIDWGAEERTTGQRWLVDFKVRESFQPVDTEETNLQMSSYQHGMAEEGLETVGSMSLQIKAVVPRAPTLNKDGRMSRQLITTDWPTYKEALEEAGLDPADYDDMREKLGTVEFWRESRCYRTSETVKNIWTHVVEPNARAMVQKHSPRRTGFGSIGCQGCLVREICLEQLRGRDVDSLVEATMKPKERRGRSDEPQAVQGASK